MSTTIQALLKEMEQEAITTRKMLERVPEDKYSWQPHEKSMTLQRLATHVAELPNWVSMTLTTDELDFANNQYEPEIIKNNGELINYFERSLASGKTELSNATDNELNKDWTLRNGNEIYFTSSKAEMIRTAYCQTVHHRAQLGVYLRLLNIPIPGSYGPSADEPSFK